jgi:hypothetical protein
MLNGIRAPICAEETANGRLVRLSHHPGAVNAQQVHRPWGERTEPSTSPTGRIARRSAISSHPSL